MSFYDRKVERQNIDNFFSKCSDNPCSKIICIEGDIGTGKTEFMKYIIKRNIDCAFSIGNQAIYKCNSIYVNNDFSYISDMIYEIYRQNIVFFEKHIEKYFSVNNHTTLLETICSLMPQIKMFSFAKGLLEKKANELSSFKSCITDKILNNQLVDFFAELIYSYLLEKVDKTEIFFCVDDIQWLDISSKNTLQTLITKAKLSQSVFISLIVTVRSKHILSQLEKENYNSFFNFYEYNFADKYHVLLHNFGELTTFEIIQDNCDEFFVENQKRIFKITKGNPQEIFQALTLDSSSLKSLLSKLDNLISISDAETMVFSTENIMELYGDDIAFGPIINCLAILGCKISNILLYKIAQQISSECIHRSLTLSEFNECCLELKRRKIIKEKNDIIEIYHDSLKDIVCDYLKYTAEYHEYVDIIVNVILNEKNQIQHKANSNLLIAIKLYQEVSPQNGFDLFVKHFDRGLILEPELCELVSSCFCKCYNLIPTMQKMAIIIDNILPRLVLYSKLALGEKVCKCIYDSYKAFDKDTQTTFLSNYIKILIDIGRLNTPSDLCAVSLLVELLEIENTDDNILMNNLLLGMSVYEHLLDFDKINELFQKAEQIVSGNEFLRPETLARFYRNKGLFTSHKNLIQDYKRAIDFSEKISNSLLRNVMMGTSMNNLGLAYFYSGDINSALKCFNDSLEHLERIGNGVGRIYNNIGLCHYIKGDYNKANSNFSIALSYEKEGAFTNICMLTNYALALVAVNKKEYALHILDEIINEYFSNNMRCKDTVCYSAALLNRAYIYFNDDDYMQAYKLIKESTKQTYRHENDLHQKKRKELMNLCLYKEDIIEIYCNNYLDLCNSTMDVFRKAYSLIPLAYYVI